MVGSEAKSFVSSPDPHTHIMAVRICYVMWVWGRDNPSCDPIEYASQLYLLTSLCLNVICEVVAVVADASLACVRVQHKYQLV